MKIDAHHHFWQIGVNAYPWLTPQMDVLYRDYTPQDLQPHLEVNNIEASVLVQAAPNTAETEYLAALASQNKYIRGIVGWIDFDDPNVIENIHDFAQNPIFVGVRPMLQDVEDPNWILDEKYRPVLAALAAHKLCFDGLVRPIHLENLGIIAKQHPSLPIVVDHGGKPNIEGAQWEDWASDLADLAQNETVYCKVSGLWTEAGGHISDDHIKPYLDHLLACFGSSRLMWGSDWPVLNIAGAYDDWHDQCQRIFSTLRAAEKNAIFGLNAERFYGL